MWVCGKFEFRRLFLILRAKEIVNSALEKEIDLEDIEQQKQIILYYEAAVKPSEPSEEEKTDD